MLMVMLMMRSLEKQTRRADQYVVTNLGDVDLGDVDQDVVPNLGDVDQGDVD